MTTIVDFDDLKSILELELTALTDYPDLSLMADQVHSALENYCGRYLDESQKLTEIGFIHGNYINLKALPVSSVSSITIDGKSVDLYSLTNYGIRLNTSYAGKEYSVSYRGGFKTIPEDVYRAELSQIIYEYQNKNNLGSETFTNDGGSVTTKGLILLPEVKRLLAPYVSVDRLGY